MQSERHSECRIPNSTFPQQTIRVLVVSEGSGGHLIPALEVSRALAAQHAAVVLLYASRTQTAQLVRELLQGLSGIQTHPVSVSIPRTKGAREIGRLWQGSAVWRVAQTQLTSFRPDMVVGFGGWFCVPVMLAARQHGIPTLIHEQNVCLGRANRFLLHWVDQFALSFEETCQELNGTPRVVTGLPIRQDIGSRTREEAANRLGLDPQTTTVLVLGGSQGSHAINQLMVGMLGRLSAAEQATWQFLHLTGPGETPVIRQTYELAHAKAWVAPHLADMASAYALADVVIGRAGASTIAELARCGKPAILIPYPHAGGHQQDNARVVESVGAGFQLDEATATPDRLLAALRQLLSDEAGRHAMAERMRALARPDAAQRLVDVILNCATVHAQR